MELQHALHLSRMQCAGLREIATKWEYELKQLREFSEFESMTIQSEVVINEPQPDPVLVRRCTIPLNCIAVSFLKQLTPLLDQSTLMFSHHLIYYVIFILQ